GPAHRLLVQVCVGGVDQAAAALEGTEDGGLRLVRGEQEGADTRHGHLHAVVQRYLFHDVCVLSEFDVRESSPGRERPAVPIARPTAYFPQIRALPGADAGRWSGTCPGTPAA